jgi:hypothetical protein
MYLPWPYTCVVGAFQIFADARPVGPVNPARLFSRTGLNDAGFAGAVHGQVASNVPAKNSF